MKYKIMAVATLIVACAFGDFNINWKSENNHVGNQPGTLLIADGSYAALIWRSDAAAPSENTSLTLGGIADDGSEHLLAWTTDTVGGGFLYDVSSKNYGDAAVGGANINNGYFFTRIFDTAVPTTGNYYVQAQVVGPALVDAGSPPDGSKVYNENVFEGSSFGQVDVQYTVIPEPATIGLVGVAGLGMFLARRKTRR